LNFCCFEAVWADDSEIGVEIMELLKTLKSLVYPGTLSFLESDEDLKLLGPSNLRLLVQRLRAKEDELSEKLGKTKEAERFIGAADGDLKVRQGPVPLNSIESKVAPEGSLYARRPSNKNLEQLKSGDTTLVACGWCEHRGSGAYSADAMVSGQCGFLYAAVGTESPECLFDTACLVLNSSKEQRVLWLSSASKKAASFFDQRNKARQLIRELLALERLSLTDQPVIPSWRVWNAFDIDQEVRTWMRSTREPLLSTAPVFAAGKVVGGYRHHDGMVHVETFERISSNEYKDGHGITLAYQTPHVLSTRDFDALKAAFAGASPEERHFGHLWLKSTDFSAAQQQQFVQDLLAAA
jgi:hypothetical protein